MTKKTAAILIVLISLLTGATACSNEAWDELPSPIASFITQYFPGSTVKAYTHTDEGSIAYINNGATIHFDTDNSWTEIDGNGVRLPQVMMYDQLPPALYDYLQSTDRTADVYVVTRDNKFYKLTLLDTVITYNLSTGAITYPGEAGK